MSGHWLPEAGVRSLEKYLVPTEEQLVFVVRRHWLTLAEPILTAVISGILTVLLAGVLGQRMALVADLIFIAWLLVLARLIYRVLDWRTSWFGSTQRRLMLIHGLITRQVAMMPLEKVTDMSYGRSPIGQLLGYGEFVLESAGQEQALRSVKFLPTPDDLYRLLLSTMFARKNALQLNPFASPQSAPPAPGRPATASSGTAWPDHLDPVPTDAEPTDPIIRRH